MYITKKMWEENDGDNLIQYDPSFSSCRFCYGGGPHNDSIILISFYNNMPIKIKKGGGDFENFYNLFSKEIKEHKKGKLC